MSVLLSFVLPLCSLFFHMCAFFDFIVSMAVPTRIPLILPIFESFWFFLWVDTQDVQGIMLSVTYKVTLIDHCKWCGNVQAWLGPSIPHKVCRVDSDDLTGRQRRPSRLTTSHPSPTAICLVKGILNLIEGCCLSTTPSCYSKVKST